MGQAFSLCNSFAARASMRSVPNWATLIWRRRSHAGERAGRILKVMDHAYRVGEIEFAAMADFIGAAFHHLHGGKGRKRFSGGSQRTIVDVDSQPPGGAVRHGPVRVAAHAAADIQYPQTPPIVRGKMRGPTPELLFVFGTQFGVFMPFEAETFGRAARQARILSEAWDGFPIGRVIAICRGFRSGTVYSFSGDQGAVSSKF